ncbi:hypothetical protein SAMN04515647_3702 [Cohaesibacter sp. ES.047]|uniref:hypothetical protein n=1 Tax=Cohaesibacter sp. ES.047 TaxID=1798205 RepID=UPI000BB7276C|nr:hypothetical protein [Cohaesibacter sp. ES.047]SNY93407.1 hypothetical protein SAMN04515647_3702 [Cohaesibacter sp. ES.047]
MSKKKRIAKAIEIAVRWGGIDGAHHKAWAIDQMVRALTGCPDVTGKAIDCKGRPYTYTAQGESKEYQKLVKKACKGEDGPETYSWDTGIAP